LNLDIVFFIFNTDKRQNFLDIPWISSFKSLVLVLVECHFVIQRMPVCENWVNLHSHVRKMTSVFLSCLLFISEHLTHLVEAAQENNITFMYAISPGIDITFSSTKDVTYLKRKLEQVGVNCELKRRVNQGSKLRPNGSTMTKCLSVWPNFLVSQCTC
jgi:Ni,Fe-hydrogenase I cytochrome b subunit